MEFGNRRRTRDVKKIATVTDSNSGITQKQAKELGVYVLPMPFTINGQTFYEDIDLTQEQFYEKLEEGAEIATSQPTIESVVGLWNELLQTYDQIIHIPMSSGLSGSCATAMAMAQDYEGKVFVVDNQRISVTQRQSALDALELANQGMDAETIREKLLKNKLESTIYITLDTLKYLKKGGRITPAAAALGTILRIKPVLQIQGEKLDAYAKARTVKQAKTIMVDAIKTDIRERFGNDASPENVWIAVAHTNNRANAEIFRDELLQEFPNHDIYIDSLSLSVSCHIGPGALAVTCTKKLV
ncbi:MAG TPA: DegV family protein [Candidatus Fimimorpha excrementavium]|nr:DegV family protein [Candidatus Fimimorpha excrementavium]